MVENMLATVRTNAGQGDPPTPFYTNVPETANAVIKRAVNFKESEMSSFTLTNGAAYRTQKEDIKGTLLDIVLDYAPLQLTPEKWFSNDPRTTRNLWKCAWEGDGTLNTGQETERWHEMATLFKMQKKEANLMCHPLQTVQRVFREAQSPLAKEDAIVSAPGSNGMAFMLESPTSKWPHCIYI